MSTICRYSVLKIIVVGSNDCFGVISLKQSSSVGIAPLTRFLY